jgi:hypothetical protein
MPDQDLTTTEGVDERGTDAEAEGPEPGAPPGAGAGRSDAAAAPGLAVGGGHGALDDAPEPNEPG